MKKIKTALLATALLSVPALMPTQALAEYPERPVKFIVPWPAGDLEDILTRLIAEEMSKETGKPATVVNKPGGAGIIGAMDVAKTRPDGLTVGSFVADILTTHLISGNAPYQRDTFEPVGIFLDYPFVLATKASSPYNNLEELATYSQENPVSLGHFGYQALPTAITFMAAKQEGINFSSDAPFDANDCSTLANGDADVINTTTQLILACLNSGEVKLLASMTKDRISIAPDTATLFEQTGIEQTTWNGLFVRKGTPAPIKAKIADIAQKALDSQQVKDLVQNTGANVYWQGEEIAKEIMAQDFENAKQLAEFMKQ